MFDNFSPVASLATGRNGSAHCGAKFSYKMSGGGKQHKMGEAVWECDQELEYASKTYRRVGVGWLAGWAGLATVLSS